MLSNQADTHIEERAKFRDEVEAREGKLKKKADARLEKYESKFKRKLEKMQMKQSELSDRALKADQHAAGLSKRLSDSQNELALMKMRMAELTQELKSAKDLNLSTLEQQVS